MSDDETKCICKQCTFYSEEIKKCKLNNAIDFSKQNSTDCEDYLVKDKLIYF